MSLISDIFAGLGSGFLKPIADIFNKKQDAHIEQLKVDGKVDQGLLEAYIAQVNARRDLSLAWMSHFIGRLGYALFIIPLGVWWSAIITYCIVKPWVPWWPKVLALPDNILPWGTGIVAFLFLTSKIDQWTRR